MPKEAKPVSMPATNKQTNTSAAHRQLHRLKGARSCYVPASCVCTQTARSFVRKSGKALP